MDEDDLPDEGHAEFDPSRPYGNEAAWRATGNPLYVWQELSRTYLKWAMMWWEPGEQRPAAEAPPPPAPPRWCTEYLLALSVGMWRLSNAPKLIDQGRESSEALPTEAREAAECVLRVMGVTGANGFNAFSDFWSADRKDAIADRFEDLREGGASQRERADTLEREFGVADDRTIRRYVAEARRRWRGERRPAKGQARGGEAPQGKSEG